MKKYSTWILGINCWVVEFCLLAALPADSGLGCTSLWFYAVKPSRRLIYMIYLIYWSSIFGIAFCTSLYIYGTPTTCLNKDFPGDGSKFQPVWNCVVQLRNQITKFETPKPKKWFPPQTKWPITMKKCLAPHLLRNPHEQIPILAGYKSHYIPITSRSEASKCVLILRKT